MVTNVLRRVILSVLRLVIVFRSFSQSYQTSLGTVFNIRSSLPSKVITHYLINLLDDEVSVKEYRMNFSVCCVKWAF